MNLRIAPEHIRFRISADEFKSLIEHGVLSAGTAFGEFSNLYYGIRTHHAPKNPDGSFLSFSTHSGDGITRFVLTVFAEGIAKLQTDGVEKDGICEHLAFENGDLLTIGLEIDLHSRKDAVKS